MNEFLDVYDITQLSQDHINKLNVNKTEALIIIFFQLKERKRRIQVQTDSLHCTTQILL